MNDDFSWNGRNFEQLINDLDQNIRELMTERAEFGKYHEVVKRNWFGDEFQKAEVKLDEIDKSLDKIIKDQTTQRNDLQQRNEDFASTSTGF